MTVRVGLGPGLGTGLSAQDYWQWIDLCEAGGVDSIWHSDQLLGATLEPVAMLAALAARTRRMRFGTSAIVIPFRHPIVLAKEFAAIDFLGEGRLLPVFGVGNAPDPYWAATGISASGRGARSDEAIELVRLLLEQDEVSYEGKHYRYEGPGVQPRPAKRIPLWIGGNSQAALVRTARLGDGWLGSMVGPDRAGAARRRIEAELQVTGRSIEADHYGMTLMARIGYEDDPAIKAAVDRLSASVASSDRSSVADMLAMGSAGQVIETLRRYVNAGISKFVLIPMVSGVDDLIDQTKLLIDDVVPAVGD